MRFERLMRFSLKPCGKYLWRNEALNCSHLERVFQVDT